MAIEIWRSVAGHEGLYQVSSLGRVRSLDRHINGVFYAGKMLRQKQDKDGYRRVALLNAGDRRDAAVHVLVLEAFVGPRPSPDHETRHLDGDRAHNRSSNLAWGTPSENYADQVEHGTACIHGRHNRAKLTEDNVRAIRGLFGKLPRWKIAEIFGVKKPAIDRIAWGLTWVGVE